MSAPARPRNRAATRAARADRSTSTTWILVGAGVVVAFAALLALALAGENTDTPPDVADVAVAGDPLPPLDNPANDAAVGAPAPALVGTGIDREPLDVTPGDGTPKILVFLAHWCPVCQAEVPMLRDWVDGGGLGDDVEMIAISTGVDPLQPNYPATEWLESEGWDLPALLDDTTSPAANAYGLTAYPTFVAIDADGNVVRRVSGALDPAEVDTLVDAARAGL